MRRFGDEAIHEPVLLRLPAGRSPPQGAILDLVAEIRLPRGPQNGFDERTWLRRHGVHVVVRADRWRIVGRRGGLSGFADRLREHLSRGMAPGLRGERRAVIAGIVLGEDEGLSQDLRAEFRASGLYHLLAVSGQNVALIAGGAILLVYLIGLSRIVGEVVALAAIGGYVLAVGWQPSVVRAGVAGGLASLAWLSSRPSDRWYFPLSSERQCCSRGARTRCSTQASSSRSQRSRRSSSSFRGFRRPFAGYPVPRSLAEVVAVSGACGVATAPILLTQFGVIPLYSIPANALAAPVVAPLLGIALVTAIVFPVAPPVAAALAWINGWLAAYLAACARLVGGLPYATVSARTALVLALVVVGLAYLLTQMRGPPTRASLPRSSLSPRSSGGGWRLHGGSSAPAPPTGLRITFLDVGQGDGALIQVPGGAVLVDEGPPEADVAAQLERLGVKSLSMIVLTHPQRDHVGGAAKVLRKLRVGLVLDPAIPATAPTSGPRSRKRASTESASRSREQESVPARCA